MARRPTPDSEKPSSAALSTGQPVSGETGETGDKSAAGAPPASGAAAAAPTSERPRGGRPGRKKNAPLIMQRRRAEGAKPRATAAPAAAAAPAGEAGDGEGAEGASDVPAEGEPVPEIDAVAEEVGDMPKVQDNDFLVAYFKDLTRLNLLSPAAEYELARRIGIMEEVLWVQALSFPRLVPHLLFVVEHDIGKTLAEMKVVSDAAEEAVREGRTTCKKLADSAGPAAAKLRTLDLDRLFITSVLEEIKEIDAALKNGQSHAAFPEGIAPGLWQIYVQGISVISQLIQRAKEEFVKANLRLVVSIARRFNYGRMPLADLIQEGNVGLIKAVERFDYRRGFRFSTYAAWWIRHAISRGLADKGRVVRLPIHTLAEYHTTMRAKRTLTRELGRPPSHEELAAATGLKAEKIEKMDTALLDDAISLDREVSDKDHRSFMDFLQDDEAPMTVSERLISETMLSEVQRLLEHLSPMEADILRLRFGLDTDQELTLKEIGDKYGLSRERIRQIQEQALNRMRRSLARKDLI